MATKPYSQYKKEQRDAAKADVEQAADLQTILASQNIQADHAEIDQKTAASVHRMEEDRTKAVAAAKPQVDAAQVQRLVDEQTAAERMAALGLGASGAKQAAMHGAATHQRVSEQNAARQLNDTLAQLDRELDAVHQAATAQKNIAVSKRMTAKDEKVASLWQTAMKRADADALALYKAALSDETARYKAELSATNLRAQLYAAVHDKLLKKTGGVYGLSQNGTVIEM